MHTPLPSSLCGSSRWQWALNNSLGYVMFVLLPLTCQEWHESQTLLASPKARKKMMSWSWWQSSKGPHCVGFQFWKPWKDAEVHSKIWKIVESVACSWFNSFNIIITATKLLSLLSIHESPSGPWLPSILHWPCLWHHEIGCIHQCASAGTCRGLSALDSSWLFN